MTARTDHGALVAGVAFVVIGMAFLLQRLDVWIVRFPHLLAVLLIGFGLAMLVGRAPRRSPTGS